MKFNIYLCTIVLCIIVSLSGCSPATVTERQNASTASDTDALKIVENSPMQYISREDLKYAITSLQENYIILDVRKAADYEKSHMINSVLADMDAAKSGDHTSGIANLKSALKTASGNEMGNEDSQYIMLCYTGNSYAQKATDLLISMGIDSQNIYTLEGGYKGFTEKDTFGHYQSIIDAAANGKNYTIKMVEPKREGDYYLTPQEVKLLMENERNGDDGDKISDYYIIDTRTLEEYEKGHLTTAVLSSVFADADKSAWISRDETIANLNAAFENYPYSDGKKFLLICRGGRVGAQLLDDILTEEFAIDNSLIYILEDGYNAFDRSWTKLGAEYTQYTEESSEPGALE